MGYTISRKFSNSPKYECIDKGGKDRSNYEVKGTKNGLFVLAHKVPSDKQHNEIPIEPKLFEINAEPPPVRGNDLIPIGS